MSRIYRQLPPKGTRIGLAFSGGLDTRAAVAWMTKKGMDVYAYTADLAQPDEKNPADIPPIAMTARREGGAAHRHEATRWPAKASPPSSAARSTWAWAARSTSTPRRWAAR